MAKINEISTIYRHYLARTFRPNTVNDYSKRLLMLERFASMHDITALYAILGWSNGVFTLATARHAGAKMLYNKLLKGIGN